MNGPRTIITLTGTTATPRVAIWPSSGMMEPSAHVAVGPLTVIVDRPADIAALRDAFADAHHQLVARLIGKGDWVECGRCHNAVPKAEARAYADDPDIFGNVALLGHLCPTCVPDDDQPAYPFAAGVAAVADSESDPF